MHDTIAWSYDLLTPEQRDLFQRLAVFAGGFTVEAAEEVLGAGSLALHIETMPRPDAAATPRSSVLDELGCLLDQHLLWGTQQQGALRLGMLETIREFALARLEAAGDAARMRTAHAAYYRSLVAHAEPHLLGPGQTHWLDLLGEEQDNLRAALGWTIEAGQGGTALAIAGGQWWFWYGRGRVREGRHWLARALALHAADAAGGVARAKALHGAGMLAWAQRDLRQATAHLAESLARCTASGDTRGMASGFHALGLVAEAEQDYAQATACFERALTLFRELDDQPWIAHELNRLGVLAFAAGDAARAETLHLEALAMQRALNNLLGAALTLGNLGEAVLAGGDSARAATCFRDSLRLWVDVGIDWGAAEALAGLGAVAAAFAQWERAAWLCGATAAISALAETDLLPAGRATRERVAAAARAHLSEQAYAAAWNAGRGLSPDQAVAAALTMTAGWLAD